MWRNVLAQALYQLCLLGYLLAFGATEFAVPEPESAAGRRKHFTLIFNAFVWCQIFNEFNSRRLDNEPSAFRGVLQSKIFIGVSTNPAPTNPNPNPDGSHSEPTQ